MHWTSNIKCISNRVWVIIIYIDIEHTYIHININSVCIIYKYTCRELHLHHQCAWIMRLLISVEFIPLHWYHFYTDYITVLHCAMYSSSSSSSIAHSPVYYHCRCRCRYWTVIRHSFITQVCKCHDIYLAKRKYRFSFSLLFYSQNKKKIYLKSKWINDTAKKLEIYIK